MKTIRIRRGLDIPLAGAPEQVIDSGPFVRRVAVLGPDYPGIKPAMDVAEGDSVRAGQALFTDKRWPRVHYPAPVSGRVTTIHRGPKRVLLGVEIAVEGEDEPRFESYPQGRLEGLSRAEVVENLLASGLWTALRRRPFNAVPDPEEQPAAVFVTAMATDPLAADPQVVIGERRQEFADGLRVLGHLSSGPLYVCQAPGADLPLAGRAEAVAFAGPHPAGLPGTHIHHLHPAHLERSAWHIGYQDVIAVGHLFTSGALLNERVVALGGPGMRRPRLVRTLAGAHLGDLLRDELHEGAQRIVSGSPLSGHAARDALAFLGRYHQQVCALPEAASQSPPLGWLRPGFGAFSARRLFAGALSRRTPRPLDTSLGGGPRAIYPIGTYEQVLPFDFSATYLLRALAVGDSDEAAALGCLELAEEDLALCSFVCPGKNDFGPQLRAVLEEIEKEG
ncbi:Na(+)-translocating NADH-quinone reductase subunit A [Geoalkalibacter halelectricus]|uniref:Na(+)-translocating NADH-quinone reductase subunit A n=1 Tax=Geoalkalibacter halelectricus TaxID=2847045 RepID=A0ABY5ZNB5_9BACT|nr:Na(+)-translocating NADH-quinone reductase subunit A [Geoalkalibacter halelectricus]MDO3378697.1 Na(+)-translocating NADH-quinone reductase subunit A [Geoalkalibacter halelectricus]UWZ79994.1 Na(+)-translocating NADH-quinone reductase subunit A [Geoalkalibacter halelectricus]